MVKAILGDFRVSFHDVASSVNPSELLEREEVDASALRLDDAMPHIPVLGRERPGLVVVVDEVGHGGVLPSVGGAVHPVIDDVVDEVEHAAPPYAWVSSCVVGPEVSHECGVLPSDGRAEGVVPCVECLCGDGVLNGDVDGGLLPLVLAVAEVEHVPVEGDVLVEPPLARAVVDHDVAHGIPSEGVLAVPDERFTPAEAHVAHDDVVGVHLEGFPCDDDSFARSGLPGNGDVGCSRNPSRSYLKTGPHHHRKEVLHSSY